MHLKGLILMAGEGVVRGGEWLTGTAPLGDALRYVQDVGERARVHHGEIGVIDKAVREARQENRPLYVDERGLFREPKPVSEKSFEHLRGVLHRGEGLSGRLANRGMFFRGRASHYLNSFDSVANHLSSTPLKTVLSDVAGAIGTMPQDGDVRYFSNWFSSHAKNLFLLIEALGDVEKELAPLRAQLLRRRLILGTSASILIIGALYCFLKKTKSSHC